jgi:plastocyanin
MKVGRKDRIVVGGIALAVLALAATGLPMVASSSDAGPREIGIVVRDMAFYVDNGGEPNPVIALRPGEHVRLRLRNEDAGMRHDFTIKAWTVATRTLDDRGEEDIVEFTVPETRGTQTYQCTPHAKMMTGTVRVE